MRVTASTLALLMARVLANHHDSAVATDHLALVTDLLNAWIDLHRLPSCLLAGLADMRQCGLLVPVDDASPGEVVGRELYDYSIVGQDPDVVHPHLSRNVTEYNMAILELDPEGCIGKIL